MTPKAGPNTRRALAAPVEGSKRRKVLVLIAAFIDAGRDDPSIGEIGDRARLPRRVVVTIVDGLERAGILRVHRQRFHRNRYELLERGDR